MSRRIRVLTASSLALTLASAPAQAFRVDYDLGFGVERNDNLLFTDDNEISTTILRPGLGFSLSHDTSVWQAELTGRGEYLDYQDDRFDSTLEGVLSGRFNWVAIPERLAFTVEDDLSVQPVSTLVPDSPGNRQQVNVFSAGPTLFFDIGRTLRGAAELRFVDSDAEITEEFNSSRVNGALRATKDLSPTSRLSANLQLQRVDFDLDTVARDYDRTDLYARYARSLASIEFAVDAGLSRIDYRRGGGNRSEPLLRVEGTWRSGERHRVTLRASSQFSDTATDALAGIGTDAGGTVTVPGSVPVGEAVVNASPYEVRGLELQYTFATPRLTAVFAPYYNRLRYVDAEGFDQNTHGARGDVNWLLRPRLNVGAYGAYGQIRYLQGDRSDDTREVGLYAGYDWTRNLRTRLSVARNQRELLGQDATQNLALFTISWHNR
jgi:hypothetical protein